MITTILIVVGFIHALSGIMLAIFFLSRIFNISELEDIFIDKDDADGEALVGCLLSFLFMGVIFWTLLLK